MTSAGCRSGTSRISASTRAPDRTFDTVAAGCLRLPGACARRAARLRRRKSKPPSILTSTRTVVAVRAGQEGGGTWLRWMCPSLRWSQPADLCLSSCWSGPRHGRKRQRGTLVLARYRHRDLVADAGKLERTHFAITEVAGGSGRRTPATPTRSAARRRRSSTPTWAMRRVRPMRGSRGYQGTARSPFCRTGKITQKRFRDFSTRAMVEAGRQDQANWRRLYYGKAPKFALLLRRSFAGRPGRALQRYHSGLSRALRRIHDRSSPALSIPMFGTTGAVPSDRHEVRPRIHGLRTRPRLRAFAVKGGCRHRRAVAAMRQGRARLPAQSVPMRLRSGARLPPRCAPAWPAKA